MLSRQFKIIASILALLLLAVLVWLPFTPGFWLDSHLAQAEAHLPRIRAALAADDRFKDLDVQADPELDGSICIAGVLPKGSSGDLESLVAATGPPRPILWQVTETPFEGQKNLPGLKWGRKPE